MEKKRPSILHFSTVLIVLLSVCSDPVQAKYIVAPTTSQLDSCRPDDNSPQRHIQEIGQRSREVRTMISQSAQAENGEQIKVGLQENETVAQKRPGIPRIEAVVINPFQSATVGAEIGGVIDTVNFEPGDMIEKGEIIVQISKKRYDLAFKKAQEKLKGLRISLKRAEREVDIRSKLVSQEAGSIQDLQKAEAEVEITEYRIQEAEIELRQARLDLDACQVKAPFTGYLATRLKEPFEVVAPLEKLFSIVDSAKVYAVAHVPESVGSYFKKGAKAVFVHASGGQFFGEVDRVEAVIDPKTDTRRIHVLISNPEKALSIGMSGSLEPVE